MNILFLAPRLPYPADTGGKIRTLNILKQLAKWAEVTVVCFSFEKDDPTFARQLEKEIQVTIKLIAHEPIPFLKKVETVLWAKQPFSIAKYNSAKMHQHIKELITAASIDLVHIDHLHMAHYLEDCYSIPCVIDEHNVEYRILERCVPVEKNIIKRSLFNHQAQKMKIFETQALQGAKIFLAVSEDDNRSLNILNPFAHKGEVIPNGVDTDFFNPQWTSTATSASLPHLVFTGSMDWLPNEDAVIYFCKDILPLILKENPEVKFYVVGKSPSAAILHLAQNDPRIVVTGRVDDVRPLMDQAQVFVVPLRIGGGTRLKILEAMAMQKPVVSTTIGAEGIAHTPNKNILLADTPENFALHVLKLFKDSKQRQQIAQEGRELVCSSYDWHYMGERLKNLYTEIIHERKQQR